MTTAFEGSKFRLWSTEEIENFPDSPIEALARLMAGVEQFADLIELSSTDASAAETAREYAAHWVETSGPMFYTIFSTFIEEEKARNNDY